MSENDIAERFKRDTAQHVMTVLHDDGLYRHLRFAQPDRSGYWFEIVTWPGSLAIRGDIDGSVVFSRITDMFEFFRGKGINPQYWAEKTPDYGRSLKEYNEDTFKELVTERLEEFAEENPALAQTAKAEIFAAVRHGDVFCEEGARDLLQRWEGRGVFCGTWEWDLSAWKWGYLWCCHAIVSGIAQYDAEKSTGFLTRMSRKLRSAIQRVWRVAR